MKKFLSEIAESINIYNVSKFIGITAFAVLIGTGEIQTQAAEVSGLFNQLSDQSWELDLTTGRVMNFTDNTGTLSIKDNANITDIRKQIVAYAKQWEGYPYVWGGNNLTTGVDCSGFVQQVYKHFNYTIPRVSREQQAKLKSIPFNELQPGDLVFYASNGRVDHVAMYIGDNKIIQGYNEDKGIIVTSINYRSAYSAATVL